MDLHLRYTSQKESALNASFLTAVLLAIAARDLGLTDEDLAIPGPVMLNLAGVVIRAGVFAPVTVRDLLEPGEQDELCALICPGCPRVTSGPGRCTGCGGAAATQREYGWDWRRRRARQLRAGPPGVRVAAWPQCGRPATGVDHVVPTVHGGSGRGGQPAVRALTSAG